MNRLTKAQKDKVKRFASVADADEATAMAILKEARWDLEVGLEAYFTSPMGAVATGADAEALEELYRKYRADDDDEEMIGAAGIERFCDDIGIDPMDPVILVVALKMNAQQMGKFTKEEFLTGMRRMGAATTDKLKEKLPLLRAELEDPRSFKDVYEYSFDFSKEPNQKSLPLDTAAAMWGCCWAAGGRSWRNGATSCDENTGKRSPAIPGARPWSSAARSDPTWRGTTRRARGRISSTSSSRRGSRRKPPRRAAATETLGRTT